ncbi:MAG: hypothetical protein LBT88_04305 [Oscillospiraceae bacterium]|nr:hypothetical protein [Oscillospiraceae bacterium]
MKIKPAGEVFANKIKVQSANQSHDADLDVNDNYEKIIWKQRRRFISPLSVFMA